VADKIKMKFEHYAVAAFSILFAILLLQSYEKPAEGLGSYALREHVLSNSGMVLNPHESKTYYFTWGGEVPNTKNYFWLALKDFSIGGLPASEYPNAHRFDVDLYLNGVMFPPHSGRGLENSFSEYEFCDYSEFCCTPHQVNYCHPHSANTLSDYRGDKLPVICCGRWHTQNITVTNNEDRVISFSSVAFWVEEGYGSCWGDELQSQGGWRGRLCPPATTSTTSTTTTIYYSVSTSTVYPVTTSTTPTTTLPPTVSTTTLNGGGVVGNWWGGVIGWLRRVFSFLW